MRGVTTFIKEDGIKALSVRINDNDPYANNEDLNLLIKYFNT